jgi:phage terminase large subunit GpA-like protein
MQPDFVCELMPEECALLGPPERLTVSEWADRHRVLDASTSPEPGPWRTDRTPYLRAIMDAFNDPEIEEIVVQSSTQVGKTEVLLNTLGYLIDHRPGPCMVIYPTVEVGEDISRTRIQPMIDAHGNLRSKKLDDRHQFTTLRMRFHGMDLFISGANSASSLASKPCEFVLFDEVNKYPPILGDEADPVSLAKERTKNFPYSRKVFMVSTPTTKTGKITQELDDCEATYDYFVPCPTCGHMQTLRFPQVKWQEVDKADPERFRLVAEETFYECESCHARISDYDKPGMLKLGEWRAESERTRPRKIGFRLSSLYSPWVKFGVMAAEFLRSKPYPERLHNFVNGWLGEPWVERSTVMKSDSVFALADDRPRGVVPVEAVALVGTVDVQKNGMFYVLRAFAQDHSSWLVREGFVEAFQDLETIFWGASYPVSGDGDDRCITNLVLVDSGFRTDEVYAWVRQHHGRARAIKGATHAMKAPFQPSRIEYLPNGKPLPGGLTLWLLDVGFWKDALFRRMQMNPQDPGAWRVHGEITREYADQMVSEQKAINRNRRTGRVTEEWQKVSQHSANHFWDCEQYALAGAEMLGIRYMADPPQGPREDEPNRKTMGLKPRHNVSKEWW